MLGAQSALERGVGEAGGEVDKVDNARGKKRHFEGRLTVRKSRSVDPIRGQRDRRNPTLEGVLFLPSALRVSLLLGGCP
jgi:hypothetical protein